MTDPKPCLSGCQPPYHSMMCDNEGMPAPAPMDDYSPDRDYPDYEYLALRAAVERRKGYWEAAVRDLAAACARESKAEARVQSLLMRHNANHGDGGSVTCEDCIEARAILAARQKEESE